MDLMDMVAHTPGKKLSDELSKVLKTPEVRHLDRSFRAVFESLLTPGVHLVPALCRRPIAGSRGSPTHLGRQRGGERKGR